MEIEEQITKCKLCGDYPKPRCTSIKEGNSTIMVIGESPDGLFLVRPFMI